jgi:hypothetical protein
MARALFSAWRLCSQVSREVEMLVGRRIKLTVLVYQVASEITNIARGPTWILPHLFSTDGAVQCQCEPPLVISKSALALT